MSDLFKIKDDQTLKLKYDNSKVITLIIESQTANIELDLCDGDYKILVFNNTKEDLVLNQKGKINNANVLIEQLELNDHKYSQNCQIEVNENANLEINAIYLGINEKKIDYNLINNQRNSNVLISNNIVCLNQSNIVMNVIGQIVKGAKNSTCHQKNRCLTVDNPRIAKVLPVLKIDENDVEASHSLSSGTIDEEIMFYMNARGLSKKEALILMVNSYLMPDESFYQTFEEGLSIKELAERSVNELCSM